MDILKKYWSFNSSIKAGDLTAFIVKLVIFIVAMAVIGWIIALFGAIPVINIIAWILGTLAEIYGLIGIVTSVLAFLGIIK